MYCLFMFLLFSGPVPARAIDADSLKLSRVVELRAIPKASVPAAAQTAIRKTDGIFPFVANGAGFDTGIAIGYGAEDDSQPAVMTGRVVKLEPVGSRRVYRKPGDPAPKGYASGCGDVLPEDLREKYTCYHIRVPSIVLELPGVMKSRIRVYTGEFGFRPFREGERVTLVSSHLRTESASVP